MIASAQDELQVPVTFRGVVQHWECDRNDHWSARFYVRSFQMASETLAMRYGGNNPGAATANVRHCRFHRELFAGATMMVSSARVAGGPHDGAIVHLMTSDGRPCATALDQPGYDASAIPEISENEIALAKPRGLEWVPHSCFGPGIVRELESAVRSPGEIVRPADLDHTGNFVVNEIFARGSNGSHTLLDALGFTAEWTRTSRISRMAVELKITRHGSCGAGDALQSCSWISLAHEKVFAVRHLLLTQGERPVASVEQLLAAVNLDSRRAVPIPEFVRKAHEGVVRSYLAR